MYEAAINLINLINNHGFKAYIVGGYPRDLYLGTKSVDVDICTEATPRQITSIFKNSKLSNEAYGSVTVFYKKIRFEITTFRQEIKYEHHRFPVKIKYIKDLLEDLKRRDFTINTLCIDKDGKTIDLLDAKQDIDNKIIKTVGPAHQKIKMDILRSLRAIRFATNLNFKLDDELKKSISKHAKLLRKLSYNRKKEELDKIFNSFNCKYGIDLIKELKIYKELELNHFEKVVPSSAIGIWAQLEVPSCYPFSKHEKNLISQVKEVLKLDILDNHTLYKFGLYICVLAGEIKAIDKCLIITKYNELPIFSLKDINITTDKICEILNKKPGPFLKELYISIQNKILDGQLINNEKEIIEYIVNSY